MSNALAFAILLIHQHQARDAGHHRRLEQTFLGFLAGRLDAEQYERNLACCKTS